MFKEVRRPQLPLVRNFVSAVLHPLLLAMPDLTGFAPPAPAAAAVAAATPAAQGPGCTVQARLQEVCIGRTYAMGQSGRWPPPIGVRGTVDPVRDSRGLVLCCVVSKAMQQ